jgi:hypothetical protein
MMRHSGLTRGHCKQFAFALRKQFVWWTAVDLPKVGKIPSSDGKMIQLACKQLARAAVKEADNKRLDGYCPTFLIALFVLSFNPFDVSIFLLFCFITVVV